MEARSSSNNVERISDMHRECEQQPAAVADSQSSRNFVSSRSADRLQVQPQEAQDLQSTQSQLQASVEKLRSWQSAVESQLDDFKCRLSESEHTRERQLHNLLEVQMNLEQVSLRYDAELKNRDALTNKVNNTHTVCEILQNHCQILKETMQRCISERDRLSEMHDNQFQQICDLESKFISHQENHKTKLNCLNECLKMECKLGEQERSSYKEGRDHLIACYESRIDDVSKQLETEKMRLTNANTKIEELYRTEVFLNQQHSEKLNQLKDAVHELSTKKEMLENLLQDAQSEKRHLSKVAKEKESIEASFAEAKEKIKQLEAEKSSIENTLENLVLEFQSKEESYKLAIDDHKGAVESLGALLESTREDMEQMKTHQESQLSQLQDTLQVVRSEAAAVAAKLRSELEDSIAQYSQLKVECAQGQERENSLQLKLQAAVDSVNLLECEIEDLNKKTENASLCFEQEKQHLEEILSMNLTAMEKIACELEQTCNELEHSRELLTATQAGAQEKESMYQVQLNEANGRVLSLQAENQVLAEQQGSIKALAAEKEREKLLLLDEFEKLKQEQLSQVENERLLQAQLQEVNSNLSSHQAEIEVLKNKQASIEAEAAELESGKISLLDEVETLKRKQLSLVETQVALNKELSTLKDCIKTKETEIHKLNAVIREKECEIKHLTIRMDSQDRRGDKLEDELGMLLNQISEKECVLEALKTEHYKERAHEQAELLEKEKQLNGLKKENESVMEMVSVVEKEKEISIIECEKKIKLFISDMETFKKTSEDRSLENGKLNDILKDLKTQLLDTCDSSGKANEKYCATLADIKQAQQQLKDLQNQLNVARGEALNATHIAERIKKYNVERKKRYMDLTQKKVYAPQQTPHPNKAVPISQLETPISTTTPTKVTTPANLANPSTPRSILKSSKTPQSSPRKVTFVADYGDADNSSSSSIVLDPDETEAIFRNPSLKPVVFAAKRKEKEIAAMNRRKKPKLESSVPGTSKQSVQPDYTFKKPLVKSSSEEDGKFDWNLSEDDSSTVA